MKTFNISIFTENTVGILNRITIIFTRRHLNIDSITASECEVENVYRYTIVLKTTLEQVEKVVGQIEKQVDVIKAFYHSDDEVVSMEMALYKLRADSLDYERLSDTVHEKGARIISLSKEFVTVEKTGTPNEIRKLFEILKPFGVLEYARSGRVAITKPMKTLEEYLVEN